MMKGMSSTTALQWSNYNSKYNGPSGQALTFSMVRDAFEQLWFKEMKNDLSKQKNEKPLEILALACGTGAEVEVICSEFNAKQVSILATDYAEGMIEATKETIERIGAQDRVRVQVMDAMKIDHKDDSFDVVTLILGPMLMPDPLQVFKEITRVLRPGGWSAYLTPRIMDHHDVFNESKRKVLEQSKRSQDFRDLYQLPMMKDWGSPEALGSKLEAAGFSDVVSECVESRLNVDRGKGIDEMLDLILQNPGMSKLYEGDLSEEEVKVFRNLCSDHFHATWPVDQPPTPASFYLSSNAAIARKK